MGKTKRVIAMIIVVILLLMYILSLVFAFLDVPNWQRMFFASMGMTVILPVFAWFWKWAFDVLKRRRELEEGEEEISHRKHKS